MIQSMVFQLAPLFVDTVFVDTASLQAMDGHIQVRVYDMYFIRPKYCLLMRMHLKDIMQILFSTGNV